MFNHNVLLILIYFREEEENQELQSIFQQSSQHIVKLIDKYRKMEGKLLLKQIAKSYKIRIAFLGEGTILLFIYFITSIYTLFLIR